MSELVTFLKGLDWRGLAVGYAFLVMFCLLVLGVFTLGLLAPWALPVSVLIGIALVICAKVFG